MNIRTMTSPASKLQGTRTSQCTSSRQVMLRRTIRIARVDQRCHQLCRLSSWANGIVALSSSLAMRIFQTLNEHCSICDENVERWHRIHRSPGDQKTDQ